MKVILASHGALAQGMYDAVTIILGEQSDVEIISAYTDGNNDIDSLAEKALRETYKEGCVVVTDILGGSVNNAFLSRMRDNPRIQLITGMNLGLLLELFSKRDELKETAICSIVEEASQNCIYCNALKSETREEEFDF